SNASSSTHSDEKWYEVGSRSGVRSELDLSGYLQGTSSDSGIDATSFTATQSSTASSTGAFMAKDKIPWQDEPPDGQTAADTSPPTPDSLVISQGTEIPGKSPLSLPLGPDSGSYSPSDGAAHSRCARFLPEFVFFFFMLIFRRHQSDGLLGGQPQLRANLRGSQSPQRHTAKSSLEEDLKKLITLDSPPPSRRSLQRTLSDESIYSGQREPSSSGQRETPTDLLFSCSTMPRSPTPPKNRYKSHSLCLTVFFSFPGDLSAPDSSELDQERKKQQLQEPVLMPLPDTGADGPLDWAHLVDAAKAFEGNQASCFHFILKNKPQTKRHLRVQQQQQPPVPSRPSLRRETPACLMGKVSQLESMVKALQEDLKKEKDAKASLQAQIESLREDNQRLLEESYSASAKLKKFTEWVFNTIDMN
uniref:Signal-induced proliferation-associated 1-like protein 1-like n=1 Tax=Neolamprologus brichardi TaxID=32507 RepID=A0A3Q4M0X7_NEOBR